MLVVKTSRVQSGMRVCFLAFILFRTGFRLAGPPCCYFETAPVCFLRSPFLKSGVPDQGCTRHVILLQEILGDRLVIHANECQAPCVATALWYEAILVSPSLLRAEMRSDSGTREPNHPNSGHDSDCAVCISIWEYSNKRSRPNPDAVRPCLQEIDAWYDAVLSCLHLAGCDKQTEPLESGFRSIPSLGCRMHTRQLL